MRFSVLAIACILLLVVPEIHAQKTRVVKSKQTTYPVPFGRPRLSDLVGKQVVVEGIGRGPIKGDFYVDYKGGEISIVEGGIVSYMGFGGRLVRVQGTLIKPPSSPPVKYTIDTMPQMSGHAEYLIDQPHIQIIDRVEYFGVREAPKQQTGSNKVRVGPKVSPKTIQLKYSVSVPREMPGVIQLSGKGGTTHSRNAREEYLRCHKEGWDECLSRFTRNQPAWFRNVKINVLDDRAMPAGRQETSFSQRPREDGFKQCKTALRRLVAEHGETSVRKALSKKRLFPFFNEDFKWGFMDDTGQVVIKPRFDNAKAFAFGLAPVNIGARIDIPHGHLFGGLWGYINSQGETVIPFTLDEAFVFSEGIARVVDRQGARFIDTSGKTIFSGGGGDFKEGLAPVYSWSGDFWKTTYIDQNGKAVFSIDGNGEEFHEGLAAYTIQTSRILRKEQGLDGSQQPVYEKRSGFINKSGTVIIQPNFGGALHFSEGLAAVSVKETSWFRGKGGLWGYIERSGKFVIQPQFNGAHPFENGKALVHKGGTLRYYSQQSPGRWDGGQVLLINKKGRVLESKRDAR